MYLQRLWWSRVGEELSDFVHGGVLATFRLDFAKCPISRILGHSRKFNFTPAHDCEVRGAQDDFFNHRALEVGPVGLPASACFLSARTREVSRRTGSGAALEALGLEGPTERGKVEKLGDQGYETGSSASSSKGWRSRGSHHMVLRVNCSVSRA